MKRALSTWERLPHSLQEPNVHLEHIALVPASELHAMAKWQHHARTYSNGVMLIVVPRGNAQLHIVGRHILQSIRARGHRAAIVTVP